MRTGETLSTSSSTTTTTKAIFSPQAATVERLLWHSPVPYLFGGLAAMLGLIILALVILACSYWKHSAGHSDNNAQEGGGQRDLELSDNKPGNAVNAKPVFEEKIAVIMPGDVRPTCLATPMSSRASSSFGDGDAQTENKEKAELIAERPKQEMGTDENNHTTIITATTETRETE